MNDVPSEAGGHGPLVSGPPEPEDHTQTTIIEELQDEFAHEATKPRIAKRFPARGGKLVGLHKPMKKKHAEQAVEKDSDSMALNYTLVDIFVDAPESELADDRGLVKLSVAAGQPELGTLGFDHRLCELVGLRKGSVHEIVMQLFEGNDLALAVQVGEIGQWTADTKKVAYDDFLPASRDTTP